MPLHAGEIAFGAKSSIICHKSCKGLALRESRGQQLDFAPPAEEVFVQNAAPKWPAHSRSIPSRLWLPLWWKVSCKWELLALVIAEITVTRVSQYESEIFLSKTLQTPLLFPLLLLPHFIEFIKKQSAVILFSQAVISCHFSWISRGRNLNALAAAPQRRTGIHFQQCCG